MILWRLKVAAVAIGTFVLAVIGALLVGRMQGARSAATKRTRERLDAMRKAKEVRREVEELDDAGLRKRASKWLRK